MDADPSPGPEPIVIPGPATGGPAAETKIVMRVAGLCKTPDCDRNIRVPDREGSGKPPDYCFLHNPCSECGLLTAWETYLCSVCSSRKKRRGP